MTREEEIKMQAEKKALEPSRLMHPYAKQYKVMSAYEIGYIEGAVWADSHPHWISVDDELPPRFPLDPNESMNVITYGLHTMVNWYDYERGEWVRDSEITHWMPLPQAPKEGGEK